MGRKVRSAALVVALLCSAAFGQTPAPSDELQEFAKLFVDGLRKADFQNVTSPRELLDALNAHLGFAHRCDEDGDKKPCVRNMKPRDLDQMQIQVSASKEIHTRGRLPAIGVRPFNYPTEDWSEEMLRKLLGPPGGLTSDGNPGWPLNGGVLVLRTSSIIGVVLPEFLWNPRRDVRDSLEIPADPRMPTDDEMLAATASLGCSPLPVPDINRALSFENPFGFAVYGVRRGVRCVASEDGVRLLVLGSADGDLERRVALISVLTPTKAGDVFDTTAKKLSDLKLAALADLLATPATRSALREVGIVLNGNFIVTYDVPEPEAKERRSERISFWRRNQIDDWIDRPQMTADEIARVAGIVAVHEAVTLKTTLTTDERIETFADGTIHIGQRALARLVKGKTKPAANAIIAFVVGHEAAHAVQRSQTPASERTPEFGRLLECQADVLGAITAIKIGTVMANDRRAILEAWDAITGARFLVALSEMEGDSEHPTPAQRAEAIRFAKARVLAPLTQRDEMTAKVMALRYALEGDASANPAWALRICKRIVNYRADLMRNVSVDLKNEKTSADEFSGELVYANHGDLRLAIDAHIRLMGRQAPIGMEPTDPTETPVDGMTVTFTLAPGEQHTVPFRLVLLQLEMENLKWSRLVFHSVEEGNLLSVEPMTESRPPDASPPHDTIASGAAAEAAAPTCSGTLLNANLSPEQTALADFLFSVAPYARERFRSLMVGPALDFSGPVVGKSLVHESSIAIPGATTTMVTDADNTASIDGTMFEGTREPAEEYYRHLRETVLALCPRVKPAEREFGGAGAFSGRSMELRFSRLTTVDIGLMEHKRTGRTSVSLSIRTLPKR